MMNKVAKSIQLLQLLPQDWRNLISPFISDDEILNILDQVISKSEKGSITPPIDLIFNAFYLCRPQDVRVVIIGQDPYPAEGDAHGLAFSTLSKKKMLPKSLNNIFKEVEKSTGQPSQCHTGDLTKWAQQGVLLLNTVLTTDVGLPNAHKNIGWQLFTSAILKGLNSSESPLVAVFWGNPAQKLANLLEDRHHKLFSSHPSPLSVYRGFDGCDHFKAINILLNSRKQAQICW